MTANRALAKFKKVSKARPEKDSYAKLREQVRQTLLIGQRKIEEQKVKTYWETGKIIHTHLLANKERADYGSQVFDKLANDLDISESVLRRTLQFYRTFPISAARRKLTWRHFVTLIPIRDEKTRLELTRRAEESGWTSGELHKKIKAEVWGDKDPSKLVRDTSGIETPLKAKAGRPYTYRLIQPEQVNGEKPYLLLDLGFQTYIRFYESGFKAGGLVTSQPLKRGDYSFHHFPGTDDCLYTYNAVVERVVDGDTLRVKVDLGFDIWTRQYLRLRGIDAPEIETPEGRKAKSFVERQLEKVSSVLLVSSRSDKYDRYLADLFLPAKDEKAGPVFLNNRLLEERFAVGMRAHD